MEFIRDLCRMLVGILLSGGIFTIVYLVEFLPHLILPIFAGHMGVWQISAIGLYLAGDYLVGTNISMAICLVFHGLISQAFGSNDEKVARIIFQRSLIVGLLIFSALGVPILLNANILLIILGQDRYISHIAGNCLSLTIPGYIAKFFGDLLFGIFLAQLKTKRVIFASLCYAISILFYCQYCLSHFCI